MMIDTSNKRVPLQRTIHLVAHHEIAPHHYRLKFHAAEIANIARAGQFVHILTSAMAAPLLRRAFSILSVEGEHFEILFRVEGRGTWQMSHWKTGEEIDVIGPLGNGFNAFPEPPAKAILVGGGVGVPPMAMLASTKKPENAVIALVGARSKSEIICQEDFAKYEVPLHIATDDGSCGHRGFVTDLLKNELENEINQGRRAIVFACGPFPMLRATASICQNFEVPCQVSLEENMPCGVGVCNGCVVAVHNSVNSASDDYGRYRRICVEGPVLWGHEIDWDRFENGGCL